MKATEFKDLADKTIEKSKNILFAKGSEYNDADDYFSYFRRAGNFLGETPKQALLGMFVKHLISIADMCKSTKKFSEDLWDEKISDAINYLILLRGLVEEENNEEY